MKLLRQGDRGNEVLKLQIVLNKGLKPGSKLKADRVFGAKTDYAVREHQKAARLTVDGLVGPKTWNSLYAPKNVLAPNLRKFWLQIGEASDFKHYLQQIEKAHKGNAAVFDAVTDFWHTRTGSRYLVIAPDPRLIDFRHFFAAASESYHGGISRKKNYTTVGTSSGKTLVYGLVNELGQCVGEGMQSKLNSCFSAEDLGSNRLGAEFGRSVKIAQSTSGTAIAISPLFNTFLARLLPKSPKALNSAKLPGVADNSMESFAAIAAGIWDALFPEAY